MVICINQSKSNNFFRMGKFNKISFLFILFTKKKKLTEVQTFLITIMLGDLYFMIASITKRLISLDTMSVSLFSQYRFWLIILKVLKTLAAPLLLFVLLFSSARDIFRLR